MIFSLNSHKMLDLMRSWLKIGTILRARMLLLKEYVGVAFVNTHVVQGGEAVLSHHKGKLAQALTDLLPTVEWNAAKFGGSCTYKINTN